MHLCQNYGSHGHGQADPIGVVNMIGSPDVFMVVTIAGTGGTKHSIKVPPLCLHVVQWLYGMKVQWTTIGLDGEMFDGLSPVYDFLFEHTLCHRFQPATYQLPESTVSGVAANHFGSGHSRFIQGQLRSNEVKVNLTSSKEERLAQMGVGDIEPSRSPPPKIAKTVTVSSCVMKPIAVLVTAKSDSEMDQDKEIEDSTIQEVDSGIQESDSIEQVASPPDRNVKQIELASTKGAVHYREVILSVDIKNRCPCMDSFGSLPLGCQCNADALDIETPVDAEIFEKDQIVPKLQSGPSTNESSAKEDSFSNQEIQQINQQEPVLVAADNIADRNAENVEPAIFFPRILPANPPNRRVPPLYRWAVHINHRPNDGPLPSAVERRMSFLDSIFNVPYDANAQGREYRERQEYEWKRLLG